MSILNKVIFLLCILYSIGCATLFKGSKQNIVVTVSGADDADISVYELSGDSEKKLAQENPE